MGQKYSLKEAEVAATDILMEEIRKWRKQMAVEDAEKDPLTPYDNSDVDETYERLELPKDDEGYILTFDVDLEAEEAKKFFERYGVVVFRNCISNDEAMETENECWKFIERHLPGVRRDKPETWGKYWPQMAGNLGILGNSIFLGAQGCRNRENPRVHKAFATLFGTDKLIVSVGRVSKHRPTVPPIGKPEWAIRSNWLHWDCNPWTGYCSTFGFRVADNSLNWSYDRFVVQGILALTDCGPKDGGFHCVPGFHHHIRGWANANMGHFSAHLRDTTLSIQVPKDDPIRQDICRCPIRAGSLLIWNSFLPHAAFPNESSHGRMVQYVRMYPISDGSVAPLFGDENKHSVLFPPEYKPSELGRKLLGWDEWKK